jgi:protein-tyrosine phosphatase
MAMALFQSQVERESEQWRIESAGTWALDGYASNAQTQIVLAERGLDISAHRSRRVNREILNSFDLVLTMEAGQQEALQLEFPDLAERIYMLSQMVGLRYNIADPIGGPDEEFRSTADEIAQILADGYETILRLATSGQ